MLQTEGEGEDEIVTKIEPPGSILQALCAVGRLFVLAGAIWKGRAEYNEMQSLGIKKYFQTTVNRRKMKTFTQKKNNTCL